MQQAEHEAGPITPGPCHVAVCICTYQRPLGLQALLAALHGQVFPDVPTPALTVVVTDNEGSPVTGEICQRFQQEKAVDLIYLVERRPGISYARNSCVGHLPESTDLVAMIDDDEIPDATWLNHLLLAREHTGADVIVGPTLPVFPADAPDWIRQSGYFNKPPHPDGYENLQRDPPAATCNVLMAADIFTRKGYRFDPELSLSGGEDKLLFQELKLHGHSFAWAARARVQESIPPERATLGYLLREEYRRGSVKFYVKNKLKVSSRAKLLVLIPRMLLRALVKIAAASVRLLFKSLSPGVHTASINAAAIEIADGLGTISGILGLRRKHYRKT